MDIKTKLSIGDKIFVIWENTKSVQEICPICKGEKYIEVNEKQFSCPECYGIGYKTITQPKCWKIAEHRSNNSRVYRINMEVIKNEIKIYYFPWGESGNFFYEEDCFGTVEEAEKECDKRNKTLNP